MLIVLAWTNPWHGFFWSREDIDSAGEFRNAVREHGPGAWAFIVYAYTVVGLSVVLLGQAVVLSAGMYRAQAGVMLFGVLVPAVIDVVDWSNLFWFIHVDTVSLSFVLTGLAFLPGLFRYHLLDLTPVAWAVVIRGMKDPVVVIDPWGRIVELNPSAQRLAAYSYPEVLGVDAARAFEHWTTLARRLDGLTAQDEVSFELDGPDPAGSSTYDARISPLGSEGRQWGWVLVLRDVSERKRAAEERVRMLRAQAARTEAEAANRAKDRFLATLSHELRTPLTPVLATVTAMLADQATEDSFRNVLEMIHRNVLLEARLIDDLLDLARIRRGTLVLKREVVDAHELVNRVIEICGDDLRNARLQLKVDLTATGHHVEADPIRLQQVLWNLIKNAIKFTPPLGRVTVRSRDQTERCNGSAGDAGGGLLIEVSDTGIGIEADALPRVFDMTEQVEVTAASRRYGGLGLGLTLSRSIVRQHDGRLTASSAGVGQGATFTLELPTVIAPAILPAAEPLAGLDGAAAAAVSLGRSVRILLVDDNADTLKFLAAILQLRGHQVLTAPDMATSLTFASDAEFDLLVSDIELPDGSGLELMETIRSRRGIPGIAISGFGSHEDIEQSRAAGFALHLTKPIDFRRLEQAIQELAAIAATESSVSRSGAAVARSVR